jgi:hypothetical protein
MNPKELILHPHPPLVYTRDDEENGLTKSGQEPANPPEPSMELTAGEESDENQRRRG